MNRLLDVRQLLKILTLLSCQSLGLGYGNDMLVEND